MPIRTAEKTIPTSSGKSALNQARKPSPILLFGLLRPANGVRGGKARGEEKEQKNLAQSASDSLRGNVKPPWNIEEVQPCDA